MGIVASVLKRAAENPFPVCLLLIVLASSGAYLNVLSNDFVYDDIGQVLKNRWITDIRYVPDVFLKGVWGFDGAGAQNYYRPLMHIIYMLCYHLFGFAPWGFHLVSIALHSGVSVLVFLLIRRLIGETASGSPYSHPSFIAALLFATHPIHTEAVAWIACVPELSFTFFFLLSLYSSIRMSEEKKERISRTYYLLSILSFFLAVFCKEPALTLPFVLLIYDFVCKRKTPRLAGYLKRFAPYMLIAGIYLFLRVYALQGFAPGRPNTLLSAYEYLINVFPLFSSYMGKLLLPVNMSAFYEFTPIRSVFEGRGMLSLLVFVLYALCAYMSLRKNRVVFFAFVLLLVPLLPAFYIRALGVNVFAERYLYLPSVGFVLLLAEAVHWIMRRHAGAAVSLGLAVSLIIGIYTLATVQRNATWKSNYVLFADTLMKSPGSIEARSYFAYACLQEGEFDEAIRQYNAVLVQRPSSAEILCNLGNAYRAKRMVDNAVAHYKTALALVPNSAHFHTNLGNAYSDKGWTGAAVSEYTIALALDPNDADAHNNLGVEYGKMGLVDTALEHFQAALKLSPGGAEIRQNIAKAYMLKGDEEGARAYLGKARALTGR